MILFTRLNDFATKHIFPNWYIQYINNSYKSIQSPHLLKELLFDLYFSKYRIDYISLFTYFLNSESLFSILSLFSFPDSSLSSLNYSLSLLSSFNIFNSFIFSTIFSQFVSLLFFLSFLSFSSLFSKNLIIILICLID